MVIVKAVEVPNGEGGLMLAPETPIPATAVRTECDGINYTVYEKGD